MYQHGSLGEKVNLSKRKFQCPYLLFDFYHRSEQIQVASESKNPQYYEWLTDWFNRQLLLVRRWKTTAHSYLSISFSSGGSKQGFDRRCHRQRNWRRISINRALRSSISLYFRGWIHSSMRFSSPPLMFLSTTSTSKLINGFVFSFDSSQLLLL